MPYVVRGCIDDLALTVTAATAKEAFAKAIEWHLAERYTNVSIYDGSKSYSIHEFALAMALQEIAATLVMANNNDAGLMADERWQRKFEDPILLSDGRALHTLSDAADYIAALPKEQSDLAQWRVAIEALMLVAQSGPTVVARMAFMAALNHNVVLPFNSDAKKHGWSKCKLKRDQ
jgi:hypothetical protein